MKSYKNIYPKIYDYRNLHQAWRKAARGKRKVPEVAEFEYYLLDNLFQLEEELHTKTYHPGPYRHFYIYEPKLRLYGAQPGKQVKTARPGPGRVQPENPDRFDSCPATYKTAPAFVVGPELVEGLDAQAGACY